MRRQCLVTAAAGEELSHMEGSIFTTGGRGALSLDSINSLPLSFSTTANTVNVTAPNFSTPLADDGVPDLRVLEDAELTAMSSSASDCVGHIDVGAAKRGSSSSSCGSDDEDTDDGKEGGVSEKGLLCINEGNAEPACFGAAVQALGGRATPPPVPRVLLLL
ncbi:hypothetical protein LSCM1_03733 [Leishmania martiniquensis]|uniref:Uncharacterized protein n=1 Tax=Leishmania martiniquensis TaxID=1580590 RepID=A0A836GF06_9TRYP|nr:hypothetical protein LSCM1_03733 [Leishmania martiniquensis]